MKRTQWIGWGMAFGLAALLGAPIATQAGAGLLNVSARILDKTACRLDAASTRPGVACRGSDLKAPMRVKYDIGHYEADTAGTQRLTLTNTGQPYTLSLAATTDTANNLRRELDLTGTAALSRIAAAGPADGLILTITP